MKVIYFKSLKVDMTMLKGKEFKLLADFIRSGVKNLYGYRAQRGLTDTRLKRKALKIHFRTVKHRSRFYSLLNSLLSDQILEKIELKRTIPKRSETRPYRFIREK